MKEFFITVLSLLIGFLIGYIVRKLILERRSSYYEVKSVIDLKENKVELDNKYTDITDSNRDYLEELHRKREQWNSNHGITGKTK